MFQLPPVPASDSLLNLAPDASYEHKQGVAVLSRLRYVYELKTMNRFLDADLRQVLEGMRVPGGRAVPENIWQRIIATQVVSGHTGQQEKLAAATDHVFAAYS